MKDYKLIPPNEITEEAKRIAVLWGDKYFPGLAIMEKRKLASDIMNYAKRHSRLTEDQIQEMALKEYPVKIMPEEGDEGTTRWDENEIERNAYIKGLKYR